MSTPKFRTFEQLSLEFPLVRQAAVAPKILPATSSSVAAALREMCVLAENGDSWERIRLARIYRKGELVEKNYAEAERLLMKAGAWDWSEALPELFLIKEARYREIIWAAPVSQVIVWVHLPSITWAELGEGGDIGGVGVYKYMCGTAGATFRLGQIQNFVDQGLILLAGPGGEWSLDAKVRLFSRSFPASAAAVKNVLIRGGFIAPGCPVVSSFGEMKSGYDRGKLLSCVGIPNAREWGLLLPGDFIPPEYAHQEAFYVRGLAHMRLGEMFLKGEGVERDIRHAEYFFRHAENFLSSTGRTPLVRLRLAEFYLTQKGCVTPEDIEATAEALWEVLDQCNSKAGDWSEYEDEAAALLIKGAEQGHAALQRKLGAAYLALWVNPDLTAYSQRLAAAGWSRWYREPWPDEWAKAGMKWLRRAAQQGDEEAAKLLQEELERGGVESEPPPEIPEPDDFRIDRARKLEEIRQRFRLDDGKVYAIYDAAANCPIYVGQTRGELNSRISRYQAELAEGGDNPRPIIRKLRELGENGYYFRILERGINTQGELDLAEEYWIAKLGTYHRGYNMTPTGQYSDRFRRRF